MFTIQLGHPKINTLPAQEFEEVNEVFLRLFHEQEESIYLYWHEIPIRFRYHEDLYNSFNDMLAMLWLLQKESSGETKVILSNQLFRILWKLYWHGDDLEIVAHFEAFEPLYENYAEALNQKSELRLDKRQFLSEWKTLLHQVLVSFEAGKISIKDGKERRKLELLQQTEKTIENYGVLYAR